MKIIDLMNGMLVGTAVGAGEVLEEAGTSPGGGGVA